MPLPLLLVIPGVTALGGLGATVGKDAAKSFLKRQLNLHREDIEKWALSSVFEQMGLPDLMGENVDKQSFTTAVNSSFLSGSEFKFTNLFDHEAVKRDAFRFGVMQAASEAGLQLEDVSQKGLVDSLRAWVLQLLEEEITAEDIGELTQDARDVYEILQTYRKYKKAAADGEAAEDAGRKPLINTPEAAANRERQARYRANHKKQWVPK